MSGGQAGSHDVGSAARDRVPFSVVVRRRGHARLVALRGEVDIATADLVREALTVASGPGVDLVVDLAAVRVADTRLGSALVAARRQQVAWGGTLAVVNIPSAVWRLLHAAQFAAELGIGVAPAWDTIAPARPGAAATLFAPDHGSGRCSAHATGSPPRSPRTSSAR